MKKALKIMGYGILIWLGITVVKVVIGIGILAALNI